MRIAPFPAMVETDEGRQDRVNTLILGFKPYLVKGKRGCQRASYTFGPPLRPHGHEHVATRATWFAALNYREDTNSVSFYLRFKISPLNLYSNLGETQKRTRREATAFGTGGTWLLHFM